MRRSKPAKRIPAPDAVYNSVDIAKFKQFAYKNEKKIIESFSQSRFLKTQ